MNSKLEYNRCSIPRISMKMGNEEKEDKEKQKENEIIEKLKMLYPNERKRTINRKENPRVKNDERKGSKRLKIENIDLEKIEVNQEKGIGHPPGKPTPLQCGLALPAENVDSSRASHPLGPPSPLQSRLASHSNSEDTNIEVEIDLESTNNQDKGLVILLVSLHHYQVGWPCQQSIVKLMEIHLTGAATNPWIRFEFN